MPTRDDRKKRGAAVNRLLAKEYPDAKCSLDFASPFQLLVATILSAQCTDERVNMVTPEVFRRYPSPGSLASAPLEEIEEAVRTTGFFRNKARSLKGMAEALVARHGSEVPDRIEDLVQLPGVGRKTANVVLGNCFGTPGITVDTHVSRVSQRLGLATSTVQDRIEQDLMDVIPHKDWTHFSHRTIYHGRRVCQARKPLCERCALRRHCDYFSRR